MLYIQLFSTDVQQLVQKTEEVLTEQQRLSSSLDQEEPPDLSYIEDEEEAFWNHQVEEEEEQDNITMFTFTPVSVKSEEGDEEHPQSSQLHHRQTEKRKTGSDGEDCGGPEPCRNSDGHLQAERADQEIVEARSGLPTAISSTGKKKLSCSGRTYLCTQLMLAAPGREGHGGLKYFTRASSCS